MIEEHAVAARDIARQKSIEETIANRTSWKLSEWTVYFEPKDTTSPPMTSEEIAAAAMWLSRKGYPIPTDCPKRPEKSPQDGGCPVFKPMCLLMPPCQMARGMCSLLMTSVQCPTCKKMFNPDVELRDALSKKEYRISGMCQRCQDGVFGR